MDYFQFQFYMIKNFIIGCIFFSSLFSIGLKALLVPQKAEIIALSNTGIAGGIDVDINPSSINQKKSFIDFSNNKWLGDLSGNKIFYSWENKKYIHGLSFEYLGIDDIELRDEIPSDIPQGTINVNWISFDYVGNINNPFNFDIGYKVKLNYSKLYLQRYYGYTIDFGFKKNVHEYIDVGFVVKNLGYEYKSNDIYKIDNSVGFGMAFNYPVLLRSFNSNINLYVDIVNEMDVDLYRIGFKFSMPYVSLMFGSSYSSNQYRDYSYGLSFLYDKWEVVIGKLIHENSILGSPGSIQIRHYF